ncbi:MAG: carbohydrate porin [Leptolyngbya sp. UWPOB_LEPTO1]|uniref:iron uptake porin n=1 Tax=Leptolyngbya sp. UWPOB_LEPTO1 TaxID=2815653 RepID=UPI001AC508CB|nr:iron uptake porin [Leptolyngbya sp. UWPOB_LEPTO1]MBN8563960.1 carbohydrate porin [Leptolyngbya sp. UWPOB_LEPTO1]
MKELNWICIGIILATVALPARSQPVSDEPSEPMEQVTTVSELTDIRPSDWAYQAVKSLVERYGILSGYPDRTFRGNRPLTRNEFAAAIANVIGRIEEQLIAGNSANTIAEDMQTIRRVVAAYGEALSQLRSRVDDLDNRTATVERQQFSTTTKLSGQVYYGVTNGTNDQATLLSRVRLNLLTSFQGNDVLVTQLQAGNDGRDAISKAHDARQNLLGTNGILADGGGLDAVGVPRELRVRKLYYSFRPAENLQVSVGSNLPPSDFIDRNQFANQSGQNFGSSFFANNPLIVQNEIDRFGGAGAAIAWNANRALVIRGLYAAADSATTGLFQDRYQASLEAEYTIPNQPITVRAQYTHADINGTQINAAGLSAEWAIQRRFGVFGIFGRLGIGSYEGFNSILQQDLDLNPKTWALGVSFQNFLIPGSKAGLAVGQPFISDRLGNKTQTNFEAFFGLLLNDRLNISPSVTVVSNPNNRASPTILEWSLRVLYEF